MEAYDIGIVGAGQIGSRHLQSLARLERPACVWVFDPSPAALLTARQRWNEAGPGAALKAQFVSDMGELPNALNVAIVATDAARREAAVGALLERRRIPFLILEKLLAQEPEALSRLEALLKLKGARAWANCPRRLWPIYRDLRERFAGRTVSFRVEGRGWSIASNAIHFLDTAAFIIGRADFEITADHLSGKGFPAGRAGFVEFNGALEARCGAHSIVLDCQPGPFEVSVGLSAPGISVEVRESEKKAVHEDGRSECFEIPFQSQLTSGVVGELLDRGDCGLTPYEESAKIHRPFLEAMRDHWRAAEAKDALCCPIT